MPDSAAPESRPAPAWLPPAKHAGPAGITVTLLTAIAAWMLGSGARYQADWHDAGDWYVFAALFGTPTGLAPDQKLGVEHLIDGIDAAEEAASRLQLVSWQATRTPRAILPAGEALLAAQGPALAQLNQRLELAARFLPLADKQRSFLWFALAAYWVCAEANAGRRLTAAEAAAASQRWREQRYRSYGATHRAHEAAVFSCLEELRRRAANGEAP